MKYRIKPSLRVFDLRKSNGTVVIGKNLPLSVTIEDASNQFVEMLKLLNGELHVENIAEELQLELSVVNEAIQNLVDLNVVENVESVSNDFSMEELMYYDRQLGFFSIFPETYKIDKLSNQKKLKNCLVTIIGMGGGGTHVCRELAGIGIGNIQIVDGDRIELSNLGRQFLYDYSDIGESKVSVAKRKIEDINPFINVIEVEKFVTSQEELVCILNNSDLVVLAADEPPIILMNWVNSICVEQGIPFLTLGVNEFHCVAGPFVVPKKSPCINCIDMEDNMINPYRYELINQLKNYEFPWKEAVFPPLISLISSIVSFEISRYLLTEKSVLVGRTLTINPIDWSFEWEEWHRNSMCTTCHSKGI